VRGRVRAPGHRAAKPLPPRLRAPAGAAGGGGARRAGGGPALAAVVAAVARWRATVAAC
jgi:hypothetical protein